MQQLSELDSSFLFLETERSPLHAGGVFVFHKSGTRSKFTYNRFRDILESKLGNEPFFRQRIVETPLNLDLPAWADDPAFDLDNHLGYVTLNQNPSPCSLLELAGAIFAEPLDRSRPLWSATYVDGLENEQGFGKLHFALILKVHITAINGTTGEDILSQLLHVAPEITELPPLREWHAEPLLESGHWLGSAYSSALTLPRKLAHLAKETTASAFYTILVERLQKLNLPGSLMRVSAMPINHEISSKRIIDNIEIPLDDIRSIRQSLPNVTTNDILMGICAEALAHYLEDNNVATDRSLVALAPISVRSTSLEIKSGNQLDATLFSLATTESDPIRRIHLIHQAAQASNLYDDAISASRLTELVPSCVAAISARVYSEFMLAQKHKPMFNLPITNIPGPQFPLYFEDNELTRYVCASPLFDGIGMAMMIVSYNGVYSITTTYCPDLEISHSPFSSYLEGALKNIMERKDQGVPALDEDAPEEQTTSSGLIEDVVGLVNNLFSFSPLSDNDKTSQN